MAFQEIRKGWRFISTSTKPKFIVNGEASAYPHGNNGYAMAIPKCAMIQRRLSFLVGPIPINR